MIYFIYNILLLICAYVTVWIISSTTDTLAVKGVQFLQEKLPVYWNSEGRRTTKSQFPREDYCKPIFEFIWSLK